MITPHHFTSSKELVEWLADNANETSHTVALSGPHPRRLASEIEIAVIAHGWWRAGPNIPQGDANISMIRPLEKGAVLDDDMTVAATIARSRGWMTDRGNEIVDADPKGQKKYSLPDDFKAHLEETGLTATWEMIPASAQNMMLMALGTVRQDERKKMISMIMENIFQLKEEGA